MAKMKVKIKKVSRAQSNSFYLAQAQPNGGYTLVGISRHSRRLNEQIAIESAKEYALANCTPIYIVNEKHRPIYQVSLIEKEIKRQPQTLEKDERVANYYRYIFFGWASS